MTAELLCHFLASTVSFNLLFRAGDSTAEDAAQDDDEREDSQSGHESQLPDTEARNDFQLQEARVRFERQDWPIALFTLNPSLVRPN